MNFFKRAWLNLTAKKGRSILLVLVTTAIMLFVLAGLLIRNAADTATSNAKKSVGATVTLSANREAAFKKMRSSTSTSKSSRPKLTTSPVKLSDAKKIAKLNNVASYNATVSTSANAKGFDTISTSSSSGGMKGMGGMSSSSSGDIAITGVTNTSSVSTFESSSSKITKGRGITASDEGTNNVVIESELAKEDSLSVGDTIKLKATTGDKKTYTMKIVGIYKACSSASTQQGPGSTDVSNTVYTSYTFANTVKGSKYKNTADSVTFSISNPAKVSSVKTAGKKIINTSKYSLATDDSSYQTVKSSMNNVKSFADKIVWLVAIAGTIILALIVILMIRERRYEIGVLLSLGESRWKIVGQFFIEMVMVLIVSVVLAGFGGKFVGNKLGDQLVSQQTTTATTSTSSTSQGQPGGGGGAPSGNTGGGKPSGNMPSGGGRMGGGANSTASSAADTGLDINVTIMDLVELGGFGLAIMFLSIMLASGGILRLQPKKVLID
ncbi:MULTISPECIES: ABC transporter permease [Lactiplantibacillus]|uniref:ABC transporter permease n=1 Tax=Lactiplantibacillus pentosus TaxID=1589 RepID=A0AAW8WID3_LACPE|nr:ABC transporter permease [Lactiplantibacillus pentosus]MBU7482979.1 ABC transporter permease [Lactiplantibacillus sp. 30.2.29]MBU7460448.1 ABC transporter permease [Lactiplantibacillus pentosus]MBU7476737.1 ABC transporter permease [Lactiplantibacillus pentosus]MBU7486441.1 ABC transporter permease [Lactiplantibacillus pentosus]MBU7499467.1 ABC transporter permease [Lactiplantibacillus pentosus]